MEEASEPGLTSPGLRQIICRSSGAQAWPQRALEWAPWHLASHLRTSQPGTLGFRSKWSVGAPSAGR